MKHLLQRISHGVLAVAFSATALARDITLAWDTSPSTNVASYVLSTGVTDGGPYPQRWTIPGQTSAGFTVNSLPPGRYYFVVQAVSTANVWSDVSNQIEVYVPEPPRLTLVEPPSLLLTGVVYRATNVLGPWKELVRLPPVAVPADSGDGYFRLGLEWGRFGGN